MTTELNPDHKEVVSRIPSSFTNGSDVKPKLLSDTTTAEDLKRNLILRFGSMSRASKAIGWSESRTHQLFLGYKVPRNPDIIRRLSEGWGIDAIILTRILEKLERGTA